MMTARSDGGREVQVSTFDGIAAACVFGWEEDTDAIHRRRLDRVTAEIAR
jgi:hypothetical protein